MAVRVALWSLFFLGCLVFVFTQSVMDGVCEDPFDIPELCTANCTDADCIDEQLCCPTNCGGMPLGRRCADPVPPPPTTSTTTSTTRLPSRPTTTSTQIMNLNECTLQMDNCHDTLGTCSDTPGSFYCTCIPGYEGDGVTCRPRDLDECALGLDHCHATLATCTNTPGSFYCACIPGYEGDGVTCRPRALFTTTSPTMPPLTCANVLCKVDLPWCCLRSVQCVTYPCPRQPVCIVDPCRGDPCIDRGTCIRDCNFYESCTCISINPCDTMRCPYESECDPRTGQCIALDICKIYECPRGSVCDPLTGICTNICIFGGYSYEGLSDPFCLCGPQEVCVGGDNIDTRGSCCKDPSLPIHWPITSAAYKPTLLLPWLLFASIAYLAS